MRLIKDRNVNIITDEDNHKVILINDIVFKGKRNINWEEVKVVYIGSELPEEFTESEHRESLMGAKAKAKANAAIAIPELIQNAANPTYEENRKDKHNKNARNG